VGRYRLVAVPLAVVFGCLTPAWHLARADNGRDFIGAYSVRMIGAPGSGTSRIQLNLRLQNVSGGAINNAVVEVDALPPAPAAQSFRSAISLADRATLTITGQFTVATQEALRWSAGREPSPRIVVIATDAGGTARRYAVELIGASDGARP